MLLYFLLLLPVSLLSIGKFFPVITELPMGIEPVLRSGLGYFYFLSAIFPPLAFLLQATIWVIGWKMGLKLFALIPFLRRLLYVPRTSTD